MAHVQLPPQLHVFVRDWLSSNNVLLKSRDGHVLIDTGYVSHAPLTLALLASARGIGSDALAWIVNTHCHSDHIGGNAAIVAKYGCPVAVPRDEAPLVDRWDETALWYGYCDQRADRFTVDKALIPGSTHVWGDLEWQALAAPGHDMAALVFHNPEHGILVSGDALWENGFGVVMPPDVDPAAIPATRATIEMIAGIDVRVVIPGHGEPFTDVAAALARARERITAFEADRVRVARHALKVMLVFTLLDRRRLALGELPSYVDRIGLYRDFNRLYFRLPPSEFAAMLVTALENARAVRREGGWLVPA
jgi:glyoxylase-like metal-dependent hydrolase (beta-lactamase superfamily II)